MKEQITKSELIRLVWLILNDAKGQLELKNSTLEVGNEIQDLVDKFESHVDQYQGL